MTTLTPETTIRKVVEACPARAAFLEQMGIDLRSDADQALSEVCSNHGLSTSTVIDLLLRMDRPESAATSLDEPFTTITQLADHIVTKHHEYHRRELPRLQLLLDQISLNEVVPNLDQIRAVFESLRSELEEHMAMEEQVLFPLIQEIDRARRCPGQYSGGIDRSIAQSEHDHHCFESVMAHLRTLTNDFTPPRSAVPAYRSFVKGLADLEVDMNQHTHLEVDVLLPRAIEAEASLRSSKCAKPHEVDRGILFQQRSANIPSRDASQ